MKNLDQEIRNVWALTKLVASSLGKDPTEEDARDACRTFWDRNEGLLKEKFPSYEEFEKYFLEVVRKLEDEEGSLLSD